MNKPYLEICGFFTKKEIEFLIAHPKGKTFQWKWKEFDGPFKLDDKRKKKCRK